MKRFIIAALAVSLLAACKNETSEKSVKKEDEKGKTLAPINDSILGQSVIYEANIRQYSPEGTFAAFTKDIPQLKELGVKVIWLMPVYPISSVKRKAADGRFAEEIEDPKEREKILGSYYAISDYTGINPEFGTLEDFQELVKTAHGNGMYVILDWVANHTGWDHVWIEDVAEILYHLIINKSVGKINLATGSVISFSQIAREIIKLTKSSSVIKSIKRNGPMPHNGYRAFNIGCCKKVFSDFRYNFLTEGIKKINLN